VPGEIVEDGNYRVHHVRSHRLGRGCSSVAAHESSTARPAVMRRALKRGNIQVYTMSRNLSNQETNGLQYPEVDQDHPDQSW
jgi:hypothetical protein